MKEILILPAVGLIILGFFMPLVEVAESTSEKALSFAVDMDSAMECAVAGVPISRCSPDLLNTSFEPELNKTTAILDGMRDTYEEICINTNDRSEICILDWDCSAWSVCKNATTTMTCVDVNGCVETTTSYTMNCSAATTYDNETENTTTQENSSTTQTLATTQTDLDMLEAARQPAGMTEMKATGTDWPLLGIATIALVGLASITGIGLQRRRTIRRDPQTRLTQYMGSA